VTLLCFVLEQINVVPFLMFSRTASRAVCFTMLRRTFSLAKVSKGKLADHWPQRGVERGQGPAQDTSCILVEEYMINEVTGWPRAAWFLLPMALRF